ncbi:MAG: Flp family type IVb pilin [Sphingomonas sp.]|nr:Flp family type IVb pilin [Sphingomonas sp.]
MRLVLNICRDRKAATAVEYGFILAFIVVALIAAIIQLGATTTGLWTNVSTKVQATN